MTAFITLPRLAATLLLAFMVSACGDAQDLGPTRAELGDFRLGHNIVVVENAQRVAISREIEHETLRSLISDSIDQRFRRYEGTRLYHIAVSVDGYLLAPPGIPVVATPRSVLIIGVHLWDDELGRPLNRQRRQLTVLEGLSGESIVGSGLTRGAEEQAEALALSAARAIENWLVENSEWFNTGRPPRPEMQAALAEREAARLAGAVSEGDD